MAVSVMKSGRGERLREDFLSGYSPFRKGSYFILEGNLIVLPATMKVPLPR